MDYIPYGWKVSRSCRDFVKIGGFFGRLIIYIEWSSSRDGPIRAHKHCKLLREGPKYCYQVKQQLIKYL